MEAKPNLVDTHILDGVVEQCGRDEIGGRCGGGR